MPPRALTIRIDARAAVEVPAGLGRVVGEPLTELSRRDDPHTYRCQFLLVDALAPEPRAAVPPADWKPVRTAQLGQLQVFVYDYDIGSRIMPPPPVS